MLLLHLLGELESFHGLSHAKGLTAISKGILQRDLQPSLKVFCKETYCTAISKGILQRDLQPSLKVFCKETYSHL